MLMTLRNPWQVAATAGMRHLSGDGVIVVVRGQVRDDGPYAGLLVCLIADWPGVRLEAGASLAVGAGSTLDGAGRSGRHAAARLLAAV